LGTQIEAWALEYLSPWPELLEKQLDDYASQNVNWRQIAREKVFPFLEERLPAMKVAHQNLVEVCAPIHSTVREVLRFESDTTFVIYVGVGCGAGWATQFQDLPAVLFGLENIAECGWSRPPSITGLVAHEMGHLVHDHWRGHHQKDTGSGPWWQLYCEGFAQRLEHFILGKDTWHMISNSDGDSWLGWCQEHRDWLAAEFLRLVDEGRSISPFFGSWFDIHGLKQCGYFLGHELIKRLETSIGLKEIALLDSGDARLRREMEKLADSGA
jgi:hypothetical protein